MDRRSEFGHQGHVKEGDQAEYILDPVSVLSIAESLIHLLLTFLPLDQAKAMLDKADVIRANELANLNEQRRFGKQSQP